MALGDERRASGRAMEANRRAIDGAMRAARQSTFKRDLNALESGTNARRTGSLRVIEPRGGVPSSTARVDYTPPASTGGGMASPLTEIGTRDYHPAVLVPSSDGIFTLQIEHVKKLFMQDSNDDPHEFNYLNPDAP